MLTSWAESYLRGKLLLTHLLQRVAKCRGVTVEGAREREPIPIYALGLDFDEHGVSVIEAVGIPA